jgi:glycosyltransferase involved in cell wall biosynthesis
VSQQGQDAAKPGSERDELIPRVSVIIPTHDRAVLVRRAVDSVLCQTYSSIEVIVVIDGPSASTQAVLASIADPRLIILALPEQVGGSNARNAGAFAARGEWLAFLDDDDEWLPFKLDHQLSRGAQRGLTIPLITSRVIARSPKADYEWPRRLPAPNEPISEYLFLRRGLFQGEGLIQTSTLLIRRETFQKIPFSSGLAAHQDWDWVLRVIDSGVTLEFVELPLVIWHIEEERASVSNGSRWRDSWTWIDSVRPIVTKRAYSSFILTVVASAAAEDRAWRAMPGLLRAAFSDERPRAFDLLLCLGFWVVPRRTRRRIRALFLGNRK